MSTEAVEPSQPTTMTITEAPPETTTETVSNAPEPATGLYRLITTGDHKIIGAAYGSVGLLMGLLLTLQGVVVNVERTDTGAIDIYNSFDQFVQNWQAYTVGVVFLVVVPLFVGIATAVVPLQVGSPAIAFPRATAAAFWGWLIGAGLLLASFVTDGGFGTPNGVADPEPTVLSIVSLGLVLVSLGLASVCIATTVIALRPLGMKLHRVPVFSWSMLVASVFWLLAMAVLVANLVVLYVQFRYLSGEPVAGELVDNRLGGNSLGMWAQIQWAFSGPQVFAWVIPLLGIAGEVVPVATRVRQGGYNVMLGAIAAFGLLTFAGYAQPFFDSGSLAVTEQAVYVGQSFLVIVPVLVVMGGLADSLRRGARNVGVPASWMVASVLGLLVLLLGLGLTAARAVDELDLVGTSAETGSLHGAGGAGLLGVAAALAFWTPKLVGRKLTGLTLLGTLALAGGAVAAGLADFGSGLLDQPLLPGADTQPQDGVEALNVVATIGIGLLAIGLLAVTVDVVAALVRGGADDADDDPWGGHTLEWATSSPPPESNFTEPVGVVRSERPLLDDEAETADSGDDT